MYIFTEDKYIEFYFTWVKKRDPMKMPDYVEKRTKQTKINLNAIKLKLKDKSYCHCQ